MMETIDEIIGEMDKIVQACREKSSRIGFFAVLYRMVTIRVRDGILAGEFDDNPRMEKLDVIFAKRFIDAYHGYHKKLPITESWKLAFDAAVSTKHIVLQHLLLGMNAHINLDLGIAAVETMKGKRLEDIEGDFNKINQVLGDLVDDVKLNIGTISPTFSRLIRFSRGKEEILVNFSIKLARDGAWKFARRFATADNQSEAIEKRDKVICLLAKGLIRPGLKLRFLIWIVGLSEWKSVPEIMDQLGKLAEAQITKARA
jgi:hypothetical protein